MFALCWGWRVVTLLGIGACDENAGGASRSRQHRLDRGHGGRLLLNSSTKHALQKQVRTAQRLLFVAGGGDNGDARDGRYRRRRRGVIRLGDAQGIAADGVGAEGGTREGGLEPCGAPVQLGSNALNAGAIATPAASDVAACLGAAAAAVWVQQRLRQTSLQLGGARTRQKT